MRSFAFVLAVTVGLFVGGCAREQFVTDARHPEIAVNVTVSVAVDFVVHKIFVFKG